MNVLRDTHAALVPDGVVLEIHPTGVAARFVARGETLGPLDQSPFRRDVVATEAALEDTVRARLFHRERHVVREVVSRWDSGRDALESVSEWGDAIVHEEVRARVEAWRGAVELVEAVVFQRLRAG